MPREGDMADTHWYIEPDEITRDALYAELSNQHITDEQVRKNGNLVTVWEITEKDDPKRIPELAKKLWKVRSSNPGMSFKLLKKEGHGKVYDVTFLLSGTKLV